MNDASIPWSDPDIIRLVQLIDQQRSVQDVVSALNRKEQDIKMKARELALVLPKEFETRFFFQECR